MGRLCCNRSGAGPAWQIRRSDGAWWRSFCVRAFAGIVAARPASATGFLGCFWWAKTFRAIMPKDREFFVDERALGEEEFDRLLAQLFGLF